MLRRHMGPFIAFDHVRGVHGLAVGWLTQEVL
jgi:hypothetical protein